MGWYVFSIRGTLIILPAVTGWNYHLDSVLLVSVIWAGVDILYVVNASNKGYKGEIECD